MDDTTGTIETELIDLTGISIANLRGLDSKLLDVSKERIMKQIEKPRANLGGAGPPGRSD